MSGKKRAIDKANKVILGESHQLHESDELRVGTPIVTFKDKRKGKIVELQYVVELENGEKVILKQGEFYNNTPENDGLPF